MYIAAGVITLISGIALILSVMLQTTKADSFSAAMGGGGGMESKFKPGSKEEWLYKITKVSAVVWIISMLFTSFLWYKAH
jgi:protein translocase SecG subunit